INPGAAIVLNNSSQFISDRLPDSGTVALAGGTFAYIGNASVASTETIGTLNLGSNTGSTINLTLQGGQNVTVTAAGLAYNNRARESCPGPRTHTSLTIYAPSSTLPNQSITLPPLALRDAIVRVNRNLATSSTITGTSLNKVGFGTLILAGSNAYSGPTIIS